MNAAKKEGQEMTDTELRDVVVNFLVAGRDTTAVALSWLFHELSLNPDARKKVVQEIDSVCF
jgi:cytochrome P450